MPNTYLPRPFEHATMEALAKLEADMAAPDAQPTPPSRLHFGVSGGRCPIHPLNGIPCATCGEAGQRVEVWSPDFAARVSPAGAQAPYQGIASDFPVTTALAGAQAAGGAAEGEAAASGLSLRASGWEQILQRSKRSGGYHVDLPDATDEHDTLVLVRVTTRGARAVTLTPPSASDYRSEGFCVMHIVPALARLSVL